MKRGGAPRGKHTWRAPRTPDARSPKAAAAEDMSDATKLYQKPCRFWKVGKCSWGWGCRFYHGATCQEDPRHPEYKGGAIDFTQFPRPVTPGHFSSQSPLHLEDQTRVKQLRSAVVQIFIAVDQVASTADQFKEALLRGGVDVLGAAPIVGAHEQADARIGERATDFVVLVELSRVVLLPGDVPVTVQNVAEVVKRRWDIANHNLGVEYIELMTRAELEKIVTELTTLDNISSTVCELQNETANAMASLSLTGCQAQPPQLNGLRQKLRNFFGKLNLANSTIADFPIYGTSQPARGEIVSAVQPPLSGLSLPMQRMLSYIVGQHLTQIHMCIAHVNRMLGELTLAPSTSFVMATSTSSSLHPTPLAAPSAAVVCADQPARARIEFGRRIEPEVAVDMRTPYAISFRESNGMDVNPFSQFSRHGNP